jgi:hypothetical protein
VPARPPGNLTGDEGPLTGEGVSGTMSGTVPDTVPQKTAAVTLSAHL